MPSSEIEMRRKGQIEQISLSLLRLAQPRLRPSTILPGRRTTHSRITRLALPLIRHLESAPRALFALGLLLRAAQTSARLASAGTSRSNSESLGSNDARLKLFLANGPQPQRSPPCQNCPCPSSLSNQCHPSLQSLASNKLLKDS